MHKKILCAGCSHTNDYHSKTWASFFQNSDIVGGRGAGVEFVTIRVLYELSKKLYTKLFILWPSVNRTDLYLDEYLSQIHSYKTSSWQKNQQPTLLDHQGNEVKKHGYLLHGCEHRGNMKNFYKLYHSEHQYQTRFWMYVYAVQQMCESLNVDYVFSTVDDAKDYGKPFFDRVNLNKFRWHNGHGFIHYLTQQGFHYTFEKPNNHFSENAHKKWYNFIKKNND